MKTKLLSERFFAVAIFAAALGCVGCSNYLICAESPAKLPNGHAYDPSLSFDADRKGIFIPVYREYRPLTESGSISDRRGERLPDTTYRCAIETGLFSRCGSKRRALEKQSFNPKKFACLPISSAETAQLLIQGFTAGFESPPDPLKGVDQQKAAGQTNSFDIDLNFSSPKEARTKDPERGATVIYYPVSLARQEPAIPWWLQPTACSPGATLQGGSGGLTVNHTIDAVNFPKEITLVPDGTLAATLHVDAKGDLDRGKNSEKRHEINNYYSTNPPPPPISQVKDPLEILSFGVALNPQLGAREIRVEFRGHLGELGKVSMRQINHDDCKISTQLTKGGPETLASAISYCDSKDGENGCPKIAVLRSESNVLTGRLQGKFIKAILIDGVEIWQTQTPKCTQQRSVPGLENKICKSRVVIDLNPGCEMPRPMREPELKE